MPIYYFDMKLSNDSWKLKFWRVPQLEGIELMRVSNLTHDYPLHVHEEYCIVLILKGRETHICRGRNYEALTGDLLLLNAHEAHSTRSVGVEYLAIHILPRKLKQIALLVTGRNSETFFFSNPLIQDPSTFKLLLNLHLKLERSASSLEQESECISAMGLLINRQKGFPSKLESAGKEPRYTELVQDYLRSNYAENISLSKLASLTNLSPFHLLRTFRNQVGVPPHEYQTQVRVIQAGRLLRKGYSILDTALKTGFFDQSHLSRNFKRITGMTPGFYLSHSNIVQDAIK
jgi:AraC-like DNA-binding protein